MTVNAWTLLSLAALLGAHGPAQGTSALGVGSQRVVFTSSPSPRGFVGGLTGADQSCRDAAVAAGFEGVFLAWLGDGLLGPIDRFEHRPAAFVNVKGDRIAENWDDLTDGELAAPILHIDGSVPEVEPWSNVNVDGTSRSIATTCRRWWAASADLRGDIDVIWSRGLSGEEITATCDSPRPFYCVEQ